MGLGLGGSATANSFKMSLLQFCIKCNFYMACILLMEAVFVVDLDQAILKEKNTCLHYKSSSGVLMLKT
jgi:hypothetical protein